MLPGAKSRAWIDLDQQLVLMSFRHILPGGLDQDIIHRKRFEILLPVVDPVLILRLGYGYGALSHIHKLA